MSGYISFIIRKRDGRTYTLLRHTNSITRLLHNWKLIGDTENHLQNFINEETEFTNNLKAPVEYGLVVVDASQNIIAYAQNYTNIGVTFSDMISIQCQRVLVDENGKAVNPRVPNLKMSPFVTQYLGWEDLETLPKEDRAKITRRGFLVGSEVERLKLLWDNGCVTTPFKSLNQNPFNKFLEVVTEPDSRTSNPFPIFINLSPFKILSFSDEPGGFKDLQIYLRDELNFSFNDEELRQWEFFTELHL